MFGGNLHRIAQAQRIAFGDAELAGPALGLVGDQDQRRAAAAQPVGKMLVERRHPGAGIEDQQRDNGITHCGIGLLPHAPGERGGIGIFEAGGIDDGEFEIEEPCQPFAAITRDARRVVDQRQLAADEAVEERRFADIWATDDGNPGH